MGDVPAAATADPIPTANPVLRATSWAVTIVVPDLRNGSAETIGQAAPSASIAAKYKWVTIQDLPNTMHVPFADAVIRATFSHLAPLETTEGKSAEMIRKRAIILGAIRAGAAAALKLEASHMNVHECTSSGSRYVAGAEGAAGTISSTNGTATAKHTMAVNMTALSDLEASAANILMFMGMAIPLLQGASLVSSGHHYLPTTKNMFDGLKKQTLNIAGQAVVEWLNSLGSDLDDLAFHKACHPISPPQKRTWAKTESFSAKLKAAGLGAASIRIPAIPSDAQVGRAFQAILEEASPVIKGMGHTITVNSVISLNRAVELAIEGRPESDAIIAVQNWAKTHGSNVAFCAGIVKNQNDARGGGRSSTLKAKSVEKVMAEFATQVALGEGYARSFREKSRRAMDDGTFADPQIVA
jgi:hypothetical protein